MLRTFLRDEPDPNDWTQAVGGLGVQECMDIAQGGEGNINISMQQIFTTQLCIFCDQIT